MSMQTFMMWMLMLCTPAVWASDAAFVIRDTELMERPYRDARVLESLPARSKVAVLQRLSGWTEVQVGKQRGWVKMLSLQLEPGAAGRRADNGLRTLFNVAQTGHGSASITTGIRGLSEEQLRNLHPDPQALQRARQYAASREDAARFAADGGLKASKVDYLQGGKK